MGISKKKRHISFENRYLKIIKHQQRKIIFVTLYIHRVSTKPSCIGFVLFNVLYTLHATDTVDDMYEVVDITISLVPK